MIDRTPGMTGSCPQTENIHPAYLYENFKLALYMTYEGLQCFDFEQKLTQFFVNLALRLPFTPTNYVCVPQGKDIPNKIHQV